MTENLTPYADMDYLELTLELAGFWELTPSEQYRILSEQHRPTSINARELTHWLPQDLNYCGWLSLVTDRSYAESM